MAMGKSRTSKRSSSSAFKSTVATIVFVAMCVLAVWILSSSSIASPRSTAKAAIPNFFSSSSSASDSQGTTVNVKPSSGKRNAIYEDNPGQLPEDAIKRYDPTLSGDNALKPRDDQTFALSEKLKDSTVDVESGNTEVDGNSVGGNKQESDRQEESDTEEIGGDGKNVEEGNLKEKVAASDVANPLRLHEGKESAAEQEKQKELEIQTSEESAVTQKQKADEIAAEMQSISSEKSGFQEEARPTRNDDDREIGIQGKENNEANLVNEEIQTEETIENHQTSISHVSEGDEAPRAEENQEQEEAQKKSEQSKSDTQGVTSDDQIQHDDAIANEEQSPETKETKSQPKNREITPIEQNKMRKDSKKTRKNKRHSQSDSSRESTIPEGEDARMPKESKESKKDWSTQADESVKQIERRNGNSRPADEQQPWKLCNVTAGADYIPCLDNEDAIMKTTRKHFVHRERHCPEEPPTCLVPYPEGYKKPVEWPTSRDKIWYHNVPHTKLAEVKGHQNWVKLTGEFVAFPGGGTQFIHGALHYIDFLQKAVPEIGWGKHSRVVLDVGCGVASFGGYLFERDVITMSFAPKDEHEAQVQFALERGIPAISAVMGSQRLPFPSRVFDLVHCARCRVPWHEDGGALLLELNRVLRPGGYFVWSATPVYQKLEEDVKIWKEMSALTVSVCWELVTIQKDHLNSVGAAIYRKPETNECYEKRKHDKPPMCRTDDDPNAAWYVPLQSCMHKAPVDERERGSQWPEEWPSRLEAPPYWLNRSQMGIYGKPAPDDFAADYEHWKRVVSKSYLSGLGISWSNVRNIMDMRAVYGGFAAAMKDLKAWVMNVVTVDSPDTLPIIYERGLFGIYHDWCESFSTYPRTYDLLHADHLFSRLKKRCDITPVMAEVDRIVRPGGKLIVRDDPSAIGEVEKLLKSLHWEVHLTVSQNQEGILSAQKSNWRPDSKAQLS